MFIVKRIKLSDHRLHEVGYFNTINELKNHFANLYRTRYLLDKFSFNPYSKFRQSYCGSSEYSYIIENEKGVRFSDETIRGIFKNPKRVDYYTGSKHHCRRSCYRQIRTTQERRMACVVLKEELEPTWRGKRGCGLPNSWDDIQHFDEYNRNWKRYRKTRWK